MEMKTIEWEKRLAHRDHGPVESYSATTRYPTDPNAIGIGRMYGINMMSWPKKPGFAWVLSIRENLAPENADYSLEFSKSQVLDTADQALALAEEWENMDVVRNPDTGAYGLAVPSISHN
jgi:hypothetical protein